jgi:hypothetical protein
MNFPHGRNLRAPSAVLEIFERQLKNAEWQRLRQLSAVLNIQLEARAASVVTGCFGVPSNIHYRSASLLQRAVPSCWAMGNFHVDVAVSRIDTRVLQKGL